MKNTKRKVLIFLIIILIMSVTKVYNKFYRIDVTDYRYNFQGQMIDSPNDKYQIRITILKVEEDSKEAYIMGRLVKKIYIEPNNLLISDKNTKIIYWDKVNSNDIDDNILDIEWLDDSNIKIEDKVLNINYDKYDYRRE